jgi:CBS domain-containing protein
MASGLRYSWSAQMAAAGCGAVMLPFDTPLSWAPDLEDAIERHPLTVSPATPLVEVIALISQAHSHTCVLSEDLTVPLGIGKVVRASCVLVMQGQELQGILTERDVVRLTAKAINLAENTVADVMIHPVITLPQRAVQDIFAALFLFRRYGIRHLPIVDDNAQLVGVISHESIRQVLRPANLLRFRRVSDVMMTQVIHAPLSATVLQLAQLMSEHRVSCVVIMQRDEENNMQPVGIVTERDIVQFQAFQIDLRKTQAQTVMSTPLFLLSPEDSLWTAHQEMQTRRVGRLVVSWNWGQGVGIVTQTSLLRVFDPMEMYGVIENLQQTIQQLQAERSPSPDSPQAAPLRLNANPSPPGTGHQSLLALLDSAQDSVKYLLSEPNPSPEQQRSVLQSILNTLGQLHDEIKS